MTTNKNLRVFAVAALSLGLFSANAFAVPSLPPVEPPTEAQTLFRINARVEDSISVTGLLDMDIDLDDSMQETQKFTVERRGATGDAPGLFSITATSEHGASEEDDTLHKIKNQRGDVLPVRISYWDIGGRGYSLNHGIPLTNIVTTGIANEHRLGIGFQQENLGDPKPGIYNTSVTITVAAE